jgi:hypothetical protein
MDISRKALRETVSLLSRMEFPDDMSKDDRARVLTFINSLIAELKVPAKTQS